MTSWLNHAFAVAVCACTSVAQAQTPAPADAFTPVLLRPIAETAPVHTTNGRYQVVYELLLTNSRSVAATVERIDVLDAANPARTVHTLTGAELTRRVTALDIRPSNSTAIPPFESRLIFIEIPFEDPAQVPATITHRFTGTGAPAPGAAAGAPLVYVVGPLAINRLRPPVLEPPLRGTGWVAVNGCCRMGVHRSSLLPINGALVGAQRFAIDFMRLDDQGRLVNGDQSRPENYVSYDQPVLAVADGTVVEMRNDLDDQVPGRLPDPSTVTVQTIDGNHVVLDIGGGYFVFYAHMRKGSVTVRPGERVRVGQELGRLGNSGNTSAPHMHMHVMAGPSAVGANGLPYVFRAFTLVGAIDLARFEAAQDLGGVWTTPGAARSERANQLPLDLQIINWP